MFKLLCSLFLFSLSITVYAQGAPNTKDIEERLDLVIGIDNIQKFDFPPATKVQIGDPSVVTYTLIPNRREIIFSPKKPGSTNVTLRDTVGDPKRIYLITVTETDQSKVVSELKEFLGDIEGLEIGVKANKVYVGGFIVVPNDIGRVTTVLEQYPEVLRLVELSPQTQRIIARRMQNEIQKYQMQNVTVRVVNQVYWLEGVVSSQTQKDQALEIGLAFLPPNIESLAKRTGSVQTVKRNPIENFIAVNAKEAPPKIAKLIKITAQFVELTKNYSKLFGFKWNPFITNGGRIVVGKNQGGVTTNSEGTLTAVIDNLFPKLLTARDAGYARVLQSGVVITKEGVEASINKTSKQNFAVGSGEFARPQQSNTGFKLTISPGPAILPGEKVDLNLNVGVSSAVGSPPTEQGNEIKTNVIVKSKSTAVIGGFVKKSNSTDYDKDPTAGATSQNDSSTPLFRFLRSKSTTNEKSQFAIFVTPEIIESAADGTEEIKRKFRQRRR